MTKVGHIADIFWCARSNITDLGLQRRESSLPPACPSSAGPGAARAITTGWLGAATASIQHPGKSLRSDQNKPAV